MNQDREHLRLLSIFHYIVGGIIGLFSCFPLIHLFVGLSFITGAGFMKDSHGGGPPALFGWVFVVIALVFILGGWTLALCVIYAGTCLGQMKRYIFCLVVGGLLCMFMPVGTVLGAFTIIVLMRPTVKDLFSVSQDRYTS
jgi:hypothetical protein